MLTKISIGFILTALAIQLSRIVLKKSVRRDPSSDERSHAEKLARTILSEKGVSTSDVAKLQVDQLTVVEFIPGMPEIVASVEVETTDKSGMQDSLFFTAKPGANAPSAI